MRDKIQQWWLRHLYKKACKSLARFDNAIGKDSKNQFMKELLNRVYGKKYMDILFNDDVSSDYVDTDTLRAREYNDYTIISEFYKKQEI